MDAIDRFERRRRNTHLGVIVILALLLAALWWLESRWQERAQRTDDLLAKRADQTDNLVKEALMLLKRPTSSASSVAMYSWKAGRPFVSGTAEWCDRTANIPKSAIGDCNWLWKPVGSVDGDPIRVIGEAHAAGRPVVVIATAGHDDQPLSTETERKFGTNTNLATSRSLALANSMVSRATNNAATCESSAGSNVHCVAIPHASRSLDTSEDGRANARTPRLTVLAGG